MCHFLRIPVPTNNVKFSKKSAAFRYTLVLGQLFRKFERGYLPLVWNESMPHIYSLAVCAEEGLPFARDMTLEEFYLCSRLDLCHPVSYFLFHQSPSSTLFTFFGAVSSNLDKVPAVNTFANAFVFGDLNDYHKD